VNRSLLLYTGLFLLTCLGAWLRFTQLGLKPTHWDESVNGIFLFDLLDKFHYQYNPTHYHGPLLYFISAPALFLGNRTIEALRFTPALIGTLAIPAMILFRYQLKEAGILVAAAFLAVAPVEVYFSRTAIHEIYNVFFNFTLVGSLACWGREKKDWQLVVGAVSLACLFATKETTSLTVATMLPSLTIAWAVSKEELPFPTISALKKAALGFFVVWFLLFSSFFTNPRGLFSFFEAFIAWGQTGTEGQGHEKEAAYFVKELLLPYYRPLLLVGGLGLVWGAIKRKPLAVFSICWFLLSLGIYSTIPYKTPWCVMSFSGALFIGVGLLVALTSGLVRWLVAVVSLLMLPFYTVTVEESNIGEWIAPRGGSININLEEYDVSGHAFIYAQTLREYADLVSDLSGLLASAPTPPRLFLYNLKNPLRYYFQALNPDVWRYYIAEEEKPQLFATIDIFGLPTDKVDEVEALFEEGFVRRRYHERPGVQVDLFVRDSLWMAFEEAATAGRVKPPTAQLKSTTFSSERTAELRPVEP
jgi:uncharacterized protein (TIGR03663 family)